MRSVVVEGHGQSEVAIMDIVDYRITSSLLVAPSIPLDETSTRSAREKSIRHMRFLRHVLGE